MNNEPYKKPSLKQFKKLVEKCGGNLTKVAAALDVSRSTIWTWTKEDKEFAKVIKDERMKLFDECVITARTMAMGIPAYEGVFDDNGDPVIDPNTGRQKKVFAGWQERPDGQMVRYLMSTLGRTEGFGESPVDESDGTVKSGVPIRAWIMKMNSGEGNEE